MKNNFCETCNDFVPSHVEKHEAHYPVRGEDICIIVDARICDNCGGICSDNELLDAALRKAYDQYRDTKGIVGPDEIRNIRQKYGLSQRGLAALLGWGTITIHRYEMGSIPDEAHNQILQMIIDPINMRRIFVRNRDKLPKIAQIELDKRLEKIIGGDEAMSELPGSIDYNMSEPPDIYNGYKRFSSETLENMILYLADKLDGVGKTKLMKLLWLAEFIHFTHNTVSISGAKYAHLPHGPALDGYDNFLSQMKLDGLIEEKETVDHGYPGYAIIALQNPDRSQIPDSAFPVMDAVSEKFKNSTAKQMSDLSHDEDAWKETKDGKIISYDYASKLRVKIDL